uniref:BAR domain-containing protein n=1 Tax=Onchocerca volvulus TaxID=6282 RepID=A0A8R1U0Y5_ONCVO
MTTKIKVAAYRLTGGSKTVYSANYEEKISVFNNFKGQIEKLINLAVTLITDNLATELKQKISKDSVDSGMNKFEKVGQTLYKYSSQIKDDSSASILQKAKEVFDKAGQTHRSFRINMLEKMQKPMKEWIETNAKHVSKELKSVNSKRDELDYAINKLRRKPDDLELQAMKQHAESTFKEELEKADKLLDDEIKEAVRQIFFLILLLNLSISRKNAQILSMNLTYKKIER